MPVLESHLTRVDASLLHLFFDPGRQSAVEVERPARHLATGKERPRAVRDLHSEAHRHLRRIPVHGVALVDRGRQDGAAADRGPLEPRPNLGRRSLPPRWLNKDFGKNHNI